MRARIKAKIAQRENALAAHAAADRQHRANLVRRNEALAEIRRLHQRIKGWEIDIKRYGSENTLTQQIQMAQAQIARLQDKIRVEFGSSFRREQTRLRQARRRARLKI